MTVTFLGEVRGRLCSHIFDSRWNTCILHETRHFKSTEASPASWGKAIWLDTLRILSPKILVNLMGQYKVPFPPCEENGFPMSEYHGKTLPEVNFSQNNYFLPLNLFLNPFIASEPITGVQILSGKYCSAEK